MQSTRENNRNYTVSRRVYPYLHIISSDYICAGLGTPFFSVRYVTFFYVLKRECYVLFRSLVTYQTPKERYVLFRSFLKNGKEREERYVLLQRTEKNRRTFRSFAKRTGERYVLFSSVTFSFEIYIEIYIDIYIYIYIDIYRHIYIEKRTERSLKRTERSFYVLFSEIQLGQVGQLGKERKKNVLFFLKERKRTERMERSFEKNGKNETFFQKEQKRTERMKSSFEKNGKERKERNVLLKRTDAQPWRPPANSFS